MTRLSFAEILDVRKEAFGYRVALFA